MNFYQPQNLAELREKLNSYPLLFSQVKWKKLIKIILIVHQINFQCYKSNMNYLEIISVHLNTTI